MNDMSRIELTIEEFFENMRQNEGRSGAAAFSLRVRRDRNRKWVERQCCFGTNEVKETLVDTL